MWKDLWERHRGVTLGIAGGLFFGFIYLFCGFWDTLVFALIVWIGVYVGRKVDRRDEWMNLRDISDLLRRLTERWRTFK